MQKQAAYMWKFFQPNNMYGSGGNSSFIIQEKKYLEPQCHQEQHKQQLRPSHIISVNYLGLDQAYATHEFQVQSKPLCQNNLIQNLGEFEAKSQVLERNYNKVTIHHFHSRDYSESSLFYSTLKNRKPDTYFLFCFHNLKSQLIIYIQLR